MVPIPWQQFNNPVLRHVCDASEHIGQPCLRIDVVVAVAMAIRSPTSWSPALHDQAGM